MIVCVTRSRGKPVRSWHFARLQRNRVQRDQSSESNGSNHHAKTDIPVPIERVRPTTPRTADIQSIIIERPTPKRARRITLRRIIFSFVVLLIILSPFGRTPLPYIPTHIQHAVLVRPFRKTPHRARRADSGISIIRVFGCNVAVPRILASVGSARDFFPFGFRRQANRDWRLEIGD